MFLYIGKIRWFIVNNIISFAGKSRSTTMIVAYLIRHQLKTVDEALAMIR